MYLFSVTIVLSIPTMTHWGLFFQFLQAQKTTSNIVCWVWIHLPVSSDAFCYFAEGRIPNKNLGEDHETIPGN